MSFWNYMEYAAWILSAVFGLYILIEVFGPVSGAHFNPAVSLVMALRGALPKTLCAPYVVAQLVGAVLGAWLAHAMFDATLLQFSTKVRGGTGQWIAEVVATAGLLGDKWNLGFLAETERQVVRHLEGHLGRLPAADEKSRAIVEQMRDDEARHATTALDHGGAELPAPVKAAMQASSKVMTGAAYFL